MARKTKKQKMQADKRKTFSLQLPKPLDPPTKNPTHQETTARASSVFSAQIQARQSAAMQGVISHQWVFADLKRIFFLSVIAISIEYAVFWVLHH